MAMKARDMLVRCTLCERAGSSVAMYRMAHRRYCPSCAGRLVRDGLARHGSRQSAHRQRALDLTPAGEIAFPGLVTVASCVADGMPIYRRWIQAGIATTDPRPLCPYCLGREREIDGWPV
jgi:hypothetical protein